MKKTTMLALTALLAVSAGAHCQVPCGIYNDAARIVMMEEHVTTIEKSMKEINSAQLSANQLTRWVMNKEKHADELTEIVTYYFLAQRIKSSEPAEKYAAELKLLHGMIVEAMKSKQTTELQHVEVLRTLIHQFEHLYLGENAEMHSH